MQDTFMGPGIPLKGTLSVAHSTGNTRQIKKASRRTYGT